jgi:hypothetical protein
MTALRITGALDENEADFQKAVIDLARTLGYKVAHFRAAKTSKGWRTPVAADGKGWPDLCIVGRNRIIFAELKAAKGRPTREQMEWINYLRDNGQEAHVWRPDDWDRIMETLTGRSTKWQS